MGVRSVRYSNYNCFPGKKGNKTTHQEEIVILRFRSEILENGLFPIPLHVIPVVNHSVSNGIMYPITWRFRIC